MHADSLKKIKLSQAAQLRQPFVNSRWLSQWEPCITQKTEWHAHHLHPDSPRNYDKTDRTVK